MIDVLPGQPSLRGVPVVGSILPRSIRQIVV